jgi:hypothetical protein
MGGRLGGGARNNLSIVMPAPVAGIHVYLDGREDVDGRDKPGHDG